MSLIHTIELTNKKINLHTDSRQYLLEGSFNKDESFKNIVEHLDSVDLARALDSEYAKVKFGKQKNLRFFITNSSNQIDLSEIPTLNQSCIVIDFRTLPLFLYKFKFYAQGVYTAVVCMNHKCGYVVRGSKGLLIKVLFNIINQGTYSLCAARLSNQGGSIWFSESQVERFPSKLVLGAITELSRRKSRRKFGFVVNLRGEKAVYEDYDVAETYKTLKNIPFCHKENFLLNLNEDERSPVIIEINPFGYVTFLKKVKTHKTKNHTLYLVRGNTSLADFTQRPLIKDMNIGGLSTSLKTAKLKAFVEAAERHCAGDIQSAIIEFHSTKEIKKLSEKILGYSVSEQAKESGSDTPYLATDTQYPCVKAFKLKLSSKEINLMEQVPLPLDVVYYPVDRGKVERFTYSNSSGCAGHSSYQKAILNAVLELSERDSIMLAWLNKLSLPIVRNESLPHEVQDRISEIEAFSNKKVYLLDASLDKKIPHFISVIYDQGGRYPLFHIGAGAALSKNDAISKSLYELETPVYFSDTFNSSDQSTKLQNLTEVTQVKHHYMYYHNPVNANDIKFILSGDYINYSEIANGNDIDELWKLGGDWYAADLTNDFFSRHNVYVVRVLSTELVPIWFGNKCMPIKKERIDLIRRKFKNLNLDTRKHNNLFLHPMG